MDCRCADLCYAHLQACLHLLQHLVNLYDSVKYSCRVPGLFTAWAQYNFMPVQVHKGLAANFCTASSANPHELHIIPWQPTPNALSHLHERKSNASAQIRAARVPRIVAWPHTRGRGICSAINAWREIMLLRVTELACIPMRTFPTSSFLALISLSCKLRPA